MRALFVISLPRCCHTSITFLVYLVRFVYVYLCICVCAGNSDSLRCGHFLSFHCPAAVILLLHFSCVFVSFCIWVFVYLCMCGLFRQFKMRALLVISSPSCGFIAAYDLVSIKHFSQERLFMNCLWTLSLPTNSFSQMRQ